MSFGSLFNIGNRNITDTRGQAIMNVIDPAGSTGIVLNMAGVDFNKSYRVGGEPAPVEEIPVPDPNAAANVAQEDQNKRRRTILNSGGQTKTSQGSTDLAIGQVGLKTLLGA